MPQTPDTIAAPRVRQLAATPVPGWAKLAWLAVLRDGALEVEAYHGSHVVIGKEWLAEAVWAAPFAEGDFDTTDLVVGTGIRCRGSHVIFVTSGHSLDRLWYCRRPTGWIVSNSLPSLLAFTGLKLLEDHGYDEDIRTVYGATPPVKAMPVEGGEIQHVWFDNLLYDGHSLSPIPKPDSAPRFTCFDDYFNFLVDVAQLLGQNMADPARPERIVPVASISSGYDSPAAAVLARFAGCTQSATIRYAASVWRGSDSGEAIARHLGMSCKVYPRTTTEYPWEEAVWAAANRSGIINWTQFEFPQPLALLFTGCYGDMLWERIPPNREDSVTFTSQLVLGLGEWRLLRGVFNCPVPFWGIRHAQEIRSITSSAEMQPWTMYSRYDRPVARRIIEQAGVPRGCYAARKKDATSEVHFRWPFSAECRRRFGKFARARGLYVPKPVTLRILRRLAIGETLLSGATGRIGMDLRLRYRFQLKASKLIFHWANMELAQQYGSALRACLQNPASPGTD